MELLGNGDDGQLGCEVNATDLGQASLLSGNLSAGVLLLEEQLIRQTGEDRDAGDVPLSGFSSGKRRKGVDATTGTRTVSVTGLSRLKLEQADLDGSAIWIARCERLQLPVCSVVEQLVCLSV